MEADWEMEIGGRAPVIEPCWAGFVDLRRSRNSRRACRKPENFRLSPMRWCGSTPHTSPVWTAKCDVWQPDQIDPDELDAPEEEAVHAIACYIDLLPRRGSAMGHRPGREMACREVCARDCVTIPLAVAAALDLVIRQRAYVTAGREGPGDYRLSHRLRIETESEASAGSRVGTARFLRTSSIAR